MATGDTARAVEVDPSGITVSGKFIRCETAKPYRGGDGVERFPARVRLLVGGGTLDVEYQSMDQAVAALTVATGKAEPNELQFVSLPAFARGQWNAAEKRWGRVSFTGRGVRGA